MSDITIAIKAQDREIKRLTQQTDKLKRSLGGLGPAAKIAGGAIAAIGVARLGSSIVGTIRQFEDLRATLVTIEGDATKAAKSFGLIQEFTAGTPFQLAEVTNAFITFRNAGLNPTTEFMTNVGNIAAGMGQRIDSVARAVFNATTGEFEMLKQLGIKVKTEGDKLTVNFKGTATTIDNDGRAIIKLINEIGQTEFAGGIDRQSKTLTGALSNLQDNFAILANAIGEGGLTTALNTITQDFVRLAGENKDLAHAIGKELGDALLFVRNNFELLKNVIIALGIGSIIISFGKLATGIAAVTTAIRIMTAAAMRNPIIAGATLLAAGIGFVVTKFGLFSESTDEATESTQKNTKALLTSDEAYTQTNKSLFENTAQTKINTKEKEKAEAAQKKLTESYRKQLDEILLLNESELESFARKEAEKQKILNEGLANQSISYEEYLKGTAELDEFYAGKRKALDQAERTKANEARQKELENQKKAEDERKQKAEDTIKGIREGNLDFYKNKEVLEKNAAAVTIAQGKRTVDVLATQNETFFNIQKAIKIAEAVQNTYVAATRALGSLPPPFNFAAAALVTAAGFAQVQQIRASQFPGREKGGPVTGGRPYVVGEAGPEMFVPGSSGTVVPNNRMGGAVTVNFNIQAIDTSDFDDLLLTRQDMIVSLINRAMKERGKRSITA